VRQLIAEAAVDADRYGPLLGHREGQRDRGAAQHERVVTGGRARHRGADRLDGFGEHVVEAAIAYLRGPELLLPWRGEADLDLVGIARGDLGPDLNLHADERDTEVQAATGRPGGDRVQDQADRCDPHVPPLVGDGHVRRLDRPLDGVDDVGYRDAVFCDVHWPTAAEGFP
jgi:hypothetical protein